MPVSPEPAVTSPDPDWAHLLGHLLWETWARAALLGEAGLADTSLTLPSLGVLDAISTWPGITVAEISRRTPKTQQAISQVVARLEKLGYLERRLRPGRGVGLHITPAGQKAHREGTAREATLEQHLHDLLGTDRYNQLRTLLEQTCQLLTPELDPPSSP
jgi:DNA-binding MarR family transcriptional regulator